MDVGALHRALVERSFDLVIVVDDEARVLWTGPQLGDRLGYEPSDVLGAAVLDFVHPDDVELTMSRLSSAIVGLELVDPTEVRVRHADGTYRWFDTVGGMLDDRPELAPAQLSLHLREVTHRHESADEHEMARAAAEEAVRQSERRHRALLLHSADSIVVIGRDGTIEQVNPDRGLFGPRPAETVLGTNALDYVFEADRPEMAEKLEELLTTPDAAVEAQLRVRDRNGQLRWIGVTGTNMTEDDAVRGVVLNYRDITARVTAEQDAQRLLDLLEATEDLVGVCDPDGMLLHLNRAAREFSGIAPDESLAERWAPGTWLHPAEQGLLEDEVLPALEAHGAWSGELRVLRTDGASVPVLARLVAHRPAAGGPIEFYSWILRDISERKAHEDRLTHQATHDPLTGLPNRTLLRDRLDAALRRSARSGADVAVLFVDLDHFKALNDTHGHSVGDQVLREIADRLAEGLRPEDTVARYGGDEFVVILEHLLDPSDATDVAGRIQRALSRPFDIGEEVFDIGASLGIALASERTGPGETADADVLLRAADVAMYRAKHAGRGQVAVFDDHPPPDSGWWRHDDDAPSSDGHEPG